VKDKQKASSAGRVDICTSGTRGRVDRAIGPYDNIRRGECSEKVGCSIGSEREQLSIKVVTVKFKGGEFKGE